MAAPLNPGLMLAPHVLPGDRFWGRTRQLHRRTDRPLCDRRGDLAGASRTGSLAPIPANAGPRAFRTPDKVRPEKGTQ